MAADQRAFQDMMADNHCWGCGAENDAGLQIKSFWDGDAAVCGFQPKIHHMAGPPHVLNGGIISTVIDCHCIWTSIAAAYRSEGREIGQGERIWYATGSLSVSFKRPTPIDQQVDLRAVVTDFTERRTNLTCTLSSEGQECAVAEVVAVRVPLAWLDPSQSKGTV
ncbi:MAG: PaaI family thioesterase [Chloroflexi bacterium]|nr:PaaI family thioesterase [Chloroflexota bacterium]MDA1227206.1 PaaI family thioesterase [Chloroflexota bacterium]